ncbi:MAG TPA: response regulator [Acidimicrobiales bacterium]|nr:response regulator [Acidimicrobiales bacterium]
MSTILVVDDHYDIRLLFEVALSAGDHRILQAADGQEALDVLDGEDVDLMLLDLMMPHVSGEDVLDRLGPDIVTPIVIVTARDFASDLEMARYLEMGALEVLQKPPDMDRLLDLVEAMLGVDAEERQRYRQRRITELRGGR